MTPYIQQQLKKLCDNPNWYDDILRRGIYESIYRYKNTNQRTINYANIR